MPQITRSILHSLEAELQRRLGGTVTVAQDELHDAILVRHREGNALITGDELHTVVAVTTEALEEDPAYVLEYAISQIARHRDNYANRPHLTGGGDLSAYPGIAAWLPDQAGAVDRQSYAAQLAQRQNGSGLGQLQLAHDINRQNDAQQQSYAEQLRRWQNATGLGQLELAQNLAARANAEASRQADQDDRLRAHLRAWDSAAHASHSAGYQQRRKRAAEAALDKLYPRKSAWQRITEDWL